MGSAYAQFIEDILSCFRPCFSRKAAFSWFVTIIAGFMVRSYMLGITSVIRDLALNPALYNSMEHFFRADSWEWEDIFIAWARTASSHAPLKRIASRAVLVGDGEKRASDGRYIPCTKKMVQESDSASKPSFIYGHSGALSVYWSGMPSRPSVCRCPSRSMMERDGAIND